MQCALSVILARVFGDPESWNRRMRPQIYVPDSTEEPLRDQPLECLHTVAFVKGPAALCLRHRDDNARVFPKLTTDSGKQTSGRHAVSSLSAPVLEEPSRHCAERA